MVLIAGYCDIFSNCRPVNAEGPIVRITKRIFDLEFFRNFQSWIFVRQHFSYLIAYYASRIIYFMFLTGKSYPKFNLCKTHFHHRIIIPYSQLILKYPLVFNNVKEEPLKDR